LQREDANYIIPDRKFDAITLAWDMAMAGRMLCFLIISDAESGTYPFGPRISMDNGTLSDITMMEA
jgi:hypothetical protein